MQSFLSWMSIDGSRVPGRSVSVKASTGRQRRANEWREAYEKRKKEEKRILTSQRCLDATPAAAFRHAPSQSARRGPEVVARNHVKRIGPRMPDSTPSEISLASSSVIIPSRAGPVKPFENVTLARHPGGLKKLPGGARGGQIRIVPVIGRIVSE